MNRRLDIHHAFQAIEGLAAVYYNPPSNLQMKYPCIRYSLAAKATRYASGVKHVNRPRYTVTVIDKSSESKIAETVDQLEYCKFDRQYASDGYHHYVFTIY